MLGCIESAIADIELPRLFGRGAVPNAAPTWFAATTTRSSGNTAFDDWRDGEFARIERQCQAPETRLRAFECEGLLLSFYDRMY